MAEGICILYCRFEMNSQLRMYYMYVEGALQVFICFFVDMSLRNVSCHRTSIRFKTTSIRSHHGFGVATDGPMTLASELFFRRPVSGPCLYQLCCSNNPIEGLERIYVIPLKALGSLEGSV